MKYKFIETSNYSKLISSITALEQLPPAAPKMGLGYGFFGIGKTTALERLALQTNAILLRAANAKNATSLLEEICVELSVETNGGAAKMYKRIVESLTKAPRIIVVDEIDKFLGEPGISHRFHLVDIFRDIHDQSGCIVFFVGMEQSLSKFKKYPHFYSRIVEVVEFLPNTAEDIDAFCGLSDIEIKEDLRAYFLTEYRNLREIMVLLDRAERKAEINGITTLDLKTFKELRLEIKQDGRKR